MQGFIGARSQSTLSVRLGESSTAYSSPSKEISTINGHLAGRKHPAQLASSALPGSMVLQRLDPNVVSCAALSAPTLCTRPHRALPRSMTFMPTASCCRAACSRRMLPVTTPLSPHSLTHRLSLPSQ